MLKSTFTVLLYGRVRAYNNCWVPYAVPRLRNTFIIKTFLLAFAALVSGCASTYVAPPREHNSVLTFDTPELKTFYFHLNGDNCTETARVSGKDSPFENEERSLVIPANKKVALTLFWSGSLAATRELWSCRVILSFQLEPNKIYQLKGRQDGELCSASIFELDQSKAMVDPIKSLKWMRYVKSAASIMFGQSSSTCEPIQRN